MAAPVKRKPRELLLWSLPFAVGLALIFHLAGAAKPRVTARGARSGSTERWGLSPSERRELVRDVAVRLPDWRDATWRRFPEHAWSRFDDLHASIAQHVRRRAREWGLHYSQVYLSLEEGIRSGWPEAGPAAGGLPRSAVPLDPRQQ